MFIVFLYIAHVRHEFWKVEISQRFNFNSYEEFYLRVELHAYSFEWGFIFILTLHFIFFLLKVQSLEAQLAEQAKLTTEHKKALEEDARIRKEELHSLRSRNSSKVRPAREIGGRHMKVFRLHRFVMWPNQQLFENDSWNLEWRGLAKVPFVQRAHKERKSWGLIVFIIALIS